MREPVRRGFAGALVALVALTCLGAFAPAGQAQDSFIDCQANLVGADGSELHPWTSLSDVSTIGTGDDFYLRRGTVCNGTLDLSGPGSPASPSHVEPYGPGSVPPAVVGTGEDAVRLTNTSNVVIQGLDLSNPGDNSGKKRGLRLVADGQTVTNLAVRALTIHDVGGNLDKDFGGSGGIQVDATGPGIGRFQNLDISGNDISDVSRSGIFIAGVSTSGRPRATVAWPDASSGVSVSSNTISGIAGDGIVAVGTDGAHIFSNTVSDGNLAGRAIGDPLGMICNAGIWTFNANNTLIEKNEVFGMKFNGCDGSGFDIDYDQDGTIVQGNYSHDNEGGFLLICTDDASTTARTADVRFNLSRDDGFMINSSPCSEPAGNFDDVQIYNNTVVAPNPDFGVLGNHTHSLIGAHDLAFFNNLIVATGAAPGFTCRPGCGNNLFSGLPAAGTDPVVADPLFATGLKVPGPEAASAYRLGDDSPAFNAGASLPAGATSDYFGRSIDNSVKPNIGFDQSPASHSPPPGPVSRPPRITYLKLKPTRIHAARGRGASLGRRGSRLSFRVSTSSKVKASVLALKKGRSHPKGGFTFRATAGGNVKKFTGRVKGKPLPPGRYRLVLSASDEDGAGRTVSVTFRVVR